MKKVFRLEELDCANCAAKMEHEFRQIAGVRDVSVNFMLQKMTVEAEDSEFDAVMKSIKKAMKKIEPDCSIVM